MSDREMFPKVRENWRTRVQREDLWRTFFRAMENLPNFNIEKFQEPLVQKTGWHECPCDLRIC